MTTKAVDHLHIFRRDLIKRILVDVFDYLRLQKRMKLYAFVIMPDHVHWIAQFTTADPFSAIVRDLKRHSADRVIRQFKIENDVKTLDRLAAKVTRPEKQTWKVWEDGYHAKEIATAHFLQQKLEYIHQNPCQPHWQLSRTPEEYPWSSARFYMTDEPCIIPIDDVRKIGGT